MKRPAVLLLGALLAWPAGADEGLWPFQQIPKDVLNEKYGFEANEAFFDHLRLASVSIGKGAGSFVSPNGLIVTNQHLVASCIPNVAGGFPAAAPEVEKPCSGLDARVLMRVDDVTKEVKAAAAEKPSAAQALTQRNAAIARIEKECAAKTGLQCAVVKLFSGGRYDLYQYKRYTDIRLVFAPEEALAFFGRERDSITYLRYGLDVAFLRAYEGGKPAATPNFLKWSATPVREGDLVFTAGNPAATARATTAAQLTFYRDSYFPLLLKRLGPAIQDLNAFAEKEPANRRAAQAALTDLLETYKSAAGKLIGLRDDRLVLRKTAFDKKIRNAVERDPKLGAEAGKVWDQVAAAYKTWAPFEKPYEILAASPAPGSGLFRVARQIVRSEPVTSPVVNNDAVEIVLLTRYLQELKDLGDKFAPVKQLLGGKAPAEAAAAFVNTSKLKDPAEQRRANAKSDDGMIRFAALLEDPTRKIVKKHDEIVGSLETSAVEKIAGYRYQLFGAADYPDATFTPRMEFGAVKSYVDRAGVSTPFAATFSGLFYRRTNDPSYQLPKRWQDAKGKFDSITELDFVSTCDLGGGDAGNPTLNRAGELVGVLFDGNLESLPNTYLYTDEKARAVHVSAQGIAEALEKVYQARALLLELGVATGQALSSYGPNPTRRPAATDRFSETSTPSRQAGRASPDWQP